MRILINASNLHIGGGIQVADSIIREIVNFPQYEYRVVVSAAVRKELGGWSGHRQIRIVEYTAKPKLSSVLSGRDAFLDRQVKEFSPDAVFSVFGPTYWRPTVLHLCGFAIPHYLYTKRDTPFFSRLTFKQRIRLMVMRWKKLRIMNRNAEAWVCETDDATERLQRLLPQKQVFTVSNSCNQIFEHPERWKPFSLPESSAINFLAVSAYYPHKDLSILVKTAAWLRQYRPDFDFRFIVTVAPEILNVPEELKAYVLCCGRVPLERLPSLYQQADIVIHPSLLECFSATYLEAMKMKKTLLVTDLAFAKDVCGPAAAYYQAGNAVSLAGKMLELSRSPDICQALVQQGRNQQKKFLSPTQRVHTYWQLLERLSSQHQNY